MDTEVTMVRAEVNQVSPDRFVAKARHLLIHEAQAWGKINQQHVGQKHSVTGWEWWEWQDLDKD